MKLWYDQPAAVWSEALPVGNGRLGAMIYGGIHQETIQLNEESVWSGKPLDRINPESAEILPEVRRLLREKKPREAERLALYGLSGTPESERAYQTAGTCALTILGLNEPAGYRRELDLRTGVTSTVYEDNGVHFIREVFVYSPDQCLMIRLTTKENTPFSFDLRLNRCHDAQDGILRPDATTTGFEVLAPKGGIAFAVMAKVQTKGGSVRQIGEYLVASDVTEAVIALDIETSFYHQDYQAAAYRRIQAALKKSYNIVQADAVKENAKFLDRLQLSFFSTDPELEQLPTDKRLARVQQGEEDPGLLALYFQFARYLLIASSRPGTLPANLQGIWNDSLHPSWDSKYTININTEMNYWMAESGNLSECHLPLFDLLERVKENGKQTARRMYNCRGSVAHHNTDIYADTAPQDHWVPSTFWVFGEAWLATHIWEHYLFTCDQAFLAEHFDVLEQSVLFFEDFLIENDEGLLITSPSSSPENTYQMTDGRVGMLTESATMDVEILTELFSDYIEAARVLGRTDGVEKAQETLRRLPPLKIGRYGQLQEWMEDYDEPEPGHRHISHLYALYPGHSISSEKTPDLYKAAQVSLNRRLANGGGHTGWSRAWIIGMFAAFGDGEKAYENLQAILTMGTFPNLMDNHPVKNGYVFQIDGNFGASAAMLEMLVQCRDGKLRLLPALPASLKTGQVSGVRIRGGVELAMTWKDGKVTEVTLLADRITSNFIEYILEAGEIKEKVLLEKGKPFKMAF